MLVVRLAPLLLVASLAAAGCSDDRCTGSSCGSMMDGSTPSVDAGPAGTDAATPPGVDAGPTPRDAGGCTPSCAGRSCGADGCGGTCGDCPGGPSSCRGDGTCDPAACAPACETVSVTGPYGSLVGSYAFQAVAVGPGGTWYCDHTYRPEQSALDELYVRARSRCLDDTGAPTPQASNIEIGLRGIQSAVTAPGRYTFRSGGAVTCIFEVSLPFADPMNAAVQSYSEYSYELATAADLCELEVTSYDYRAGGRVTGTLTARLSDEIGPSMYTSVNVTATFDIVIE